MPGGHKYGGPTEALTQYTQIVGANDHDVKGAKSPYTSLRGHMFSFLDADGSMALRLSDEDYAEFVETYDSSPVIQYGATMRGYVAVPDDLFADMEGIGMWFRRSRDWIGTLDPKPTKKSR